jgi:hypothetical protein
MSLEAAIVGDGTGECLSEWKIMANLPPSYARSVPHD